MALSIARVLRHLFAGSARRLYPEASLQRIAAAIAEGERSHRGETCFAVEASLPLRAVLAGEDAATRARELFAQLGVWDTAANNGVLLFLLLADHRIEIVADRGLEGRVSAEQWRGVCQLMEERLRAGEPEAAATAGIAAAAALLAEHFPRGADDHDVNELPDLPRIL